MNPIFQPLSKSSLPTAIKIESSNLLTKMMVYRMWRTLKSKCETIRMQDLMPLRSLGSDSNIRMEWLRSKCRANRYSILIMELSPLNRVFGNFQSVRLLK